MHKPISVIVAFIMAAMVVPDMNTQIKMKPETSSTPYINVEQENSNNNQAPKEESKPEVKQETKQEQKQEPKQEKKKETKQKKKKTENKKKQDTKSETASGNYRTLTVKVVAYCPCSSCSGGYGTHTRSGRTAQEGRTIAVDTRVIPLGSKVVIDGHTYIAEDVGGGVRGNMIDMYFSCHSKTEKWGCRTKTVKVYSK